MIEKIGRNDPCHCGSGKKYKKCHLEKDEVVDRKQREKAALNAAKVAAAEGEANAGEKKKPQDQGGWMKKVAGKVGFFRNPSNRRVLNKGG